MSLRDFWASVRTGAGTIPSKATVDSPKLDPDSIEKALRGTTLWMTRGAVAGFDEKDFEFLPDADRGRLAKLVTDFLEIVKPASPTSPVPGSARGKALPIYRDIIEMLGFDRYGDAEAYRLGKLIEREILPDRPEELAELRFDTGLDHSGDPALWIWVFLTEAASEGDESFLENARKIEDFLKPIARTIAIDRWSYFSFRSIVQEVESAEAS